MTARRIPTYSEIASFREGLIKSRKMLDKDEIERQRNQLVRMEFACLRAIASLARCSDQELMERARSRAQLEHIQYKPKHRAIAELEAA